MISTIIEDIFSRLSNVNSQSDSDSRQTNNVERSQLKALLHSALQKVDIVSRDEFDAQTAVLIRTRERVQELEKQLLALEQLILKDE